MLYETIIYAYEYNSLSNSNELQISAGSALKRIK